MGERETDEIQERLRYMLPGAFETNEGTVLQLRVDAIVRGAHHTLRVLAFSHLPNAGFIERGQNEGP